MNPWLSQARAVNCSDPKVTGIWIFQSLRFSIQRTDPSFFPTSFCFGQLRFWVASVFWGVCQSKFFMGTYLLFFSFSEHKIQRLLNCCQCFFTLLLCNYMNLSQCSHSMPIPVAMMFRTYVYGGSIPGSAISNLAGSMEVISLCLLSGRFRAVPVTSWSLVQKCPTACACLIVYDIEVSTMRLPRPSWTLAQQKNTK